MVKLPLHAKRIGGSHRAQVFIVKCSWANKAHLSYCRYRNRCIDYTYGVLKPNGTFVIMSECYELSETLTLAENHVRVLAKLEKQQAERKAAKKMPPKVIIDKRRTTEDVPVTHGYL